MSSNDLTSTELLQILSAVTGVSKPVAGTVNKFGENNDIDSVDTNQVIWPVKSSVQAYQFLTTAVSATIQSDNIADDLTGTGAQVVKVTYQDASGVEKTIELDLDGTTAVNLPEPIIGCFRMMVAQSGTGNINAGNITIESGGNILAIISAGEGQTQQAIQKIPTAVGDTKITRAIVKKAIAGYSRNQVTNNAFMRLRVKKPDGTVLTKLDPIVSTGAPLFEREYKIGGITADAGDWIYWEAVSVSADNTSVRGEFDLVYE